MIKGDSAHAKHYHELQAIQVMQRLLTPEQFEGYLIGNAMKYALRDKEGSDDTTKYKQHLYFLWLFHKGEMIDPKNMSVPEDFEGTLFNL